MMAAFLVYDAKRRADDAENTPCKPTKAGKVAVIIVAESDR